jgi:hypothetical protein
LEASNFGSILVYLPVYVDDILVFAKLMREIDSVKERIRQTKLMLDKPDQSVIGALIYYNITSAISVLSSFMQKPGLKYWEAVQHVLGYLNLTADE